MDNKILLYLFTTVLVLGMSGCASKQHEDLHQFMEETRNAPAGEIEPLPTFQPYRTYKYTAVAMRSPFAPPLQITAQDLVSGRASVKPDETRRKEYLEKFNFSALSMVGVLVKKDVHWALVNDGAGGIHRVKAGNYVGKNHGKIVSVTASKMDILEIVPDGKGNWVERPRTLALREN